MCCDVNGGPAFSDALDSSGPLGNMDRQGRMRELTAEDPQAETPKEFRGELYTPQKTLLAAMFALEQNPVQELDGQTSIQTRCARIAACPSFGKTVLALALVCARRPPARVPAGIPMMALARARSNGGGCQPEIAVHYGESVALTVIEAAAGVITQWGENTRRFTKLRAFVIENAHSLREFEAMYKRGQHKAFDLLFVKAGRVASAQKSRPLLAALAQVFGGAPVARLVIDDYDTLQLSADDCLIPADFTWLVSATRRRAAARAPTGQTAAYSTVEEFFRENIASAFPVAGFSLDDSLNSTFSLCCAPAYTEAHLTSTAVRASRVRVKSGRATALLRDLGLPDAVLEMVNADAVGAAMKALDSGPAVEARNVGEIVRYVVGTRLEGLRRAVNALARVGRIRALMAAVPAVSDQDHFLSAVAARLRAELLSADEGEAAVIEKCAVVASQGTQARKTISAMLDGLEASAASQRDRCGKTLSRMRANIREGCCQCCTLPFGGSPAYVLAGCCQLIVCEGCITYKGQFIDRCPNCAAGRRPAASAIRVGAEVDLRDALGDEQLLVNEAAESMCGEILTPKAKALVQLAQGKPIDCLAIEEVSHIAGLLEGRLDSPWPPAAPRKLLVFTMHAETAEHLHRALAQEGVPHARLRGTRAQKDDAIRRLRDGDCAVLLVATAAECGGLDLPFLSHVVFYHAVTDPDVVLQVAARGQRLGRKHNLEVVFLANEAEGT
jgi:hypothetical protein